MGSLALYQVCVEFQGILTLSSHLAGNMYEMPKQWLMSVSALRQLSQPVPVFGDHQKMYWRLRIDVPEQKDVESLKRLHPL